MLSDKSINNKKKTKEEIQKIRDKYKRHTTCDRKNTEDVERIDTLQQKLSVYTSRLNRYKKCHRRKDDKNFQNNEKVYTQITGKKYQKTHPWKMKLESFGVQYGPTK